LRNAKGEPLEIEFLDESTSGGRIVSPYIGNLEKLGIRATFRVVDFALLQKRLDSFDFDITGIRMPGTEAPGTELIGRFSSKEADVDGSNNLIGVKSKAVDSLLQEATSATTRPQLVAALRALDRVLRFGHYVVPNWYSSAFRVAYRAGRYQQPPVLPRYYQPDSWALSTWWATSAQDR
jgi:microcin C transport system substrate-binding protein